MSVTPDLITKLIAALAAASKARTSASPRQQTPNTNGLGSFLEKITSNLWPSNDPLPDASQVDFRFNPGTGTLESFGGGMDGGMSLAGTEGLPGIMANAGELGAGPLTLIAAGTYLGGKSGLDMLRGKGQAWGKSSLQDKIGRVTLGTATGGLSEVARKLFFNKSTKDRTKQRYGEIAGLSSDPTYQNAINTGRDWSLSGQDTWDIGDDKAAAPISGMTNSYGVLKAYGPEFASLPQEQKEAIVRELVNQDKVNSKQGEYLVDDIEGAKNIYSQVMANSPWKSAQQNTGPFNAQGQRIRDWQPGDRVYGNYGRR